MVLESKLCLCLKFFMHALQLQGKNFGNWKKLSLYMLKKDTQKKSISNAAPEKLQNLNVHKNPQHACSANFSVKYCILSQITKLKDYYQLKRCSLVSFILFTVILCFAGFSSFWFWPTLVPCVRLIILNNKP